MNSTSDQLDGLDGAVPTPPVRRNGVLSRLAGWCYDHRRRVLLIWLVALVVVSVVSGIIGSNYEDRFSGGNSESAQTSSPDASRRPQGTRPTSSSGPTHR
jgi:uncharacterized membrane protein YdfJ with MMPL/SSD domain